MLGEASEAFLTMLYRSTDCRCRCGAAVKNLTHSASFHSREKTAPSNPKAGSRIIVHVGNVAVFAVTTADLVRRRDDACPDRCRRALRDCLPAKRRSGGWLRLDHFAGGVGQHRAGMNGRCPHAFGRVSAVCPR